MDDEMRLAAWENDLAGAPEDTMRMRALRRRQAQAWREEEYDDEPVFADGAVHGTDEYGRG